MFTLVKAITHFFPSIKIEGLPFLIAITCISVGFALKKVWKPSKIKIKTAQSDTIIEVLFGDLFVQSGIRIIAVNEFFDSKIGNPVSDKSLHGIFLQKCFGGSHLPFDQQVDEQLKGLDGEEFPEK
jgi:hypothetical protein